jgi:hypothetical protein
MKFILILPFLVLVSCTLFTKRETNLNIDYKYNAKARHRCRIVSSNDFKAVAIGRAESGSMYVVQDPKAGPMLAVWSGDKVMGFAPRKCFDDFKKIDGNRNI